MKKVALLFILSFVWSGFIFSRLSTVFVLSGIDLLSVILIFLPYLWVFTVFFKEKKIFYLCVGSLFLVIEVAVFFVTSQITEIEANPDLTVEDFREFEEKVEFPIAFKTQGSGQGSLVVHKKNREKLEGVLESEKTNQTNPERLVIEDDTRPPDGNQL